jgi:hypothetical protein
VDAVRGCVAVERGPEVFCLESIDTPGNLHVDLFRVDDSVASREEDGAVLVRVRPLTPPNSELAWPYAGRRAGADGGGTDDGESYEVALRRTMRGATAARPRCAFGCRPIGPEMLYARPMVLRQASVSQSRNTLQLINTASTTPVTGVS